MVSELDFRPRGQWFEPGHCRRVASLDKKLYSTLSLFTQSEILERFYCLLGFDVFSMAWYAGN